MSSIFISHSSKDKPIIQSFIDEILVGALAVKLSNIFCTTTDGTRIQSGDEWRKSIREHLINSNIIFLIISPHYKESEVCLNEMGAAWISAGRVIPLIIDPINYDTVGVIQEPIQIEKLLDGKSLDRLKDLVQNILKIPINDIKSDRWTLKKMEFILKIEEHLKINPYPKPLSRIESEKLIDDNNNLRQLIKALIEEKQNLTELNKDLIASKDQEEVKEILSKHIDTSILDEFKNLCKKVESNLAEFTSIIIGIMFKDITGKDIRIQVDGWPENIDNALAMDYIKINSGEVEPDWETTIEMKNSYENIMQVSHFIKRNEGNTKFIELYKEQYKAPLNFSNINFWKEVFKSSILIN